MNREELERANLRAEEIAKKKVIVQTLKEKVFQLVVERVEKHGSYMGPEIYDLVQAYIELEKEGEL